MTITYLNGDATDPIKKPAIIVHGVNNYFLWGSGFVLAVSEKWPEPEQKYLNILKERPSVKGDKDLLGDIQLVKVEEDIWVCNLFSQHGIKSQYNQIPARPWAIERGFSSLQERINKNNWYNHTVHMPRIGCDRGGLNWDQIEPLLTKHITSDVFVYDFTPPEEKQL